MSKRPVEHEQEASAFYAELNKDVSYFAAIWHVYKVGHLLATDLDRICRPYNLSMADVHLLGAVRLDQAGQLRATDLAHTLHVTNAALSPRIDKLERRGLLERVSSTSDSRCSTLKITKDGVAALDAAIEDISARAHFVRCYRGLSSEDQAHLVRIMGAVHDQLDRDFVATVRSDN